MSEPIMINILGPDALVLGVFLLVFIAIRFFWW